jgi:hypothetical protein
MRFIARNIKTPDAMGYVEPAEGVSIEAFMNALREGKLSLSVEKPAGKVEPVAPAAVEAPQEGTTKETPKLYKRGK